MVSSQPVQHKEEMTVMQYIPSVCRPAQHEPVAELWLSVAVALCPLVHGGRHGRRLLNARRHRPRHLNGLLLAPLTGHRNPRRLQMRVTNFLTMEILRVGYLSWVIILCADCGANGNELIEQMR